jgi:hypothetical protein
MIWLDRYASIIASITIIMSFIHFISFIITVKMIKLMDKERRKNLKDLQRDYHLHDTSTIAERLSNF